MTDGFTSNYKFYKAQTQYIQGYFIPCNSYKCDNKNDIMYRSYLEKVFMNKIDASPNILRWGYETVEIPYILDGKKHTYYMDFIVRKKEFDGSENTYLIELKDDKNIKYYKDYLLTGKYPERGRTSIKNYTYIIDTLKMNIAKWNAAMTFCKVNGYKFKIYGKEEVTKGNFV